MGEVLGPAADPPVIHGREFWVLMGYATALGVFGAFAGLVYLGIIKLGVPLCQPRVRRFALTNQ